MIIIGTTNESQTFINNVLEYEGIFILKFNASLSHAICRFGSFRMKLLWEVA